MLLVRLSLLMEVVDGLQRLAVLLSTRLFTFQQVALLDLVVDERMQLLFAHGGGVLQVRRLRSPLLVITLRIHHQIAQPVSCILAIVVRLLHAIMLIDN